MCNHAFKLIFLWIRCLLFALIGGAVFTVMSHSNPGLLPYIVAIGAGAGWPLTRPLSVVTLGENGVIFTAFFLAVRVGIALMIGWLVLIPYTVYLIVQTVRNK